MGRQRGLEVGGVRISLVVVSYRSAGVLPACVASFRREAGAAGLEPEVVVVEHSEDETEATAAAAVAGVDRLLVRANRGYAAGINVGVDAATGELLLIANPDVELRPGSLSGILRGLEAGYAVVGPELVWDREGLVRLPVPEDPAPRAELMRAARRRWRGAWRRGLAPAVEATWRLWKAEGAVEVSSLRGPALAFRRTTYDLLGPWDEAYFLYSEETDWLWRARRRGFRLGLAAGAQVWHHWAHSTRELDGREEIEAASRRRFLERNYGLVSRAALGWLERHPGVVGLVDADVVDGPRAVRASGVDLWLLSPFPHLMPCAGWFEGETVPEAVVERTRRGVWYSAGMVREGAGRWRVIGAWRWGRP